MQTGSKSPRSPLRSPGRSVRQGTSSGSTASMAQTVAAAVRQQVSRILEGVEQQNEGSLEEGKTNAGSTVQGRPRSPGAPRGNSPLRGSSPPKRPQIRLPMSNDALITSSSTAPRYGTGSPGVRAASPKGTPAGALRRSFSPGASPKARGSSPRRDSSGSSLPFHNQDADKARPASSFALLFTFGCFMLFLTPIWQVVYLASDTDVQFWIGSWFGEVAVLLPFMFIGSFFAHFKLGRPHKITALLCLLIPSFVLILEGQEMAAIADEEATALMSTDCAAFAVKARLQKSWEEANRLMSNCPSKAVDAKARRLQCEDYAEDNMKAGGHLKDWTYLQSVEQRHECAGWCHFGKRTWASGAAKDSCSIAVGQVLSEKVGRTANQIVLYSSFVMFAGCAATAAVVLSSMHPVPVPQFST
eukprot:TRINITY_DN7464_c0_g1_i1.p1 TRINITY_DN7464_c0_g1~~TRINITY_DN7464_c0_g1_i1.p1  ORF type:complete len:415 (+),score=75.97 TRINITY_DN7464_c0_g1_i1:217-1461(+)